MGKPEIALYNCSNLVAPSSLPPPPPIHSTFAFISRFSIAQDTMVQWRDNITSKSPGIVRTITPARVILNCIRHVDPYDPSDPPCNPKLRHRSSQLACVTLWIHSRFIPLDIVHEYACVCVCVCIHGSLAVLKLLYLPGQTNKLEEICLREKKGLMIKNKK